MTKNSTLATIILAAGEGVRMASARPKVLHEIAARPMLGYVLAAAQSCAPQQIILVTAPDQDDVRKFADGQADVHHAIQKTPRGTADAVRIACSKIDVSIERVLVLFGDTPLITAEILRRLAEDSSALTLLGFTPANDDGYGRIVLDDNIPCRIVEHADATTDQRAIRLCNGGAMAIQAALLSPLLAQIANDNAQGEFYLTDIVAAMYHAEQSTSFIEGSSDDAYGVNDRVELAHAEARMQTRLRIAAMRAGVSMQAPETIHLAYDTQFGRDVHIESHVVIGCGVAIADEVTIRAFSHIENSTIDTAVQIGPFARLRGASVIGRDSRIGNFVELKAAHLDAGVKVAHLSYIGDAQIGAAVNIGAGVITCNYDGVAKHQTTIEAGAFMGSNSALIAPITIGENAYLGSGTVVSKNVPAESLALSRSPLRIVKDWVRQQAHRRMEKD